jgi:hypothetical protein
MTYFPENLLTLLFTGGNLGPTWLLGVIGHSTMSQVPSIVFNETLNDVIFDERDERWGHRNPTKTIPQKVIMVLGTPLAKDQEGIKEKKIVKFIQYSSFWFWFNFLKLSSVT